MVISLKTGVVPSGPGFFCREEVSDSNGPQIRLASNTRCFLSVFIYAKEAIGFAKNHVVIVVIVVIILLVLLCAVGALVRKVVKGLSEAKERAMSKFNALLNSKDALDLPEAVPDMEVSHVQPAHAKKKLVSATANFTLPSPALNERIWN